jgi:hypothetical protein
VAADRDMISAEAVAELEARRVFYILGVRERTDKLVPELALEFGAVRAAGAEQARLGDRLRGQGSGEGRRRRAWDCHESCVWGHNRRG